MGPVLTVAAIATNPSRTGTGTRTIDLQAADTGVAPDAAVTAGSTRQCPGVCGRVISMATHPAIATRTRRAVTAVRSEVAATRGAAGATGAGVAAVPAVASVAAIHRRCRPG